MASNNPPIIISFTSLPNRISHIEPMLNSISKQTAQPSKFILWLSKYSQRDSQFTLDTKKIPKFIQNYPVDLRICDDYGPHTKLLPALKAVQDPNTIIITVDDDTIYPKTWLENLIHYHHLYPDSAIGPRGRVFYRKTLRIPILGMQLSKRLKYRKGKTIILPSNSSPKPVDILTGVWGVLYKRSFFEEEIFSMQQCPEARYNDDIWNSGYLAKKGIQRLCIPFGKEFGDISMPGVNRLWDSVNNGKGLNDKAIAFYQNYWNSSFNGELEKNYDSMSA